MKSYTPLLLILVTLTLFACTPKESGETNNPNLEEWASLFNGKDLTGWDIKITGFEIFYFFVCDRPIAIYEIATFFDCICILF